MNKRYLSIWFPYLVADKIAVQNATLKSQPYVLIAQERNKQIIVRPSQEALKQGLRMQMPLADARISVPELQVFDYQAEQERQLLLSIAQWCIRYTPYIALVPPDGLLLEISGCTHLWKGEALYVQEITGRLKKAGYHVKVSIADTIGAAWALSHFGNDQIVAPNKQMQAILNLPPKALRLAEDSLKRLHKLGFHTVESFIHMAPSILRRRFGEALNERIGQALGHQPEAFMPIEEPHPYRERLNCLEPIKTAKGIEIAIQNLLGTICLRLQQEGLGIRNALLQCYRLDGKCQQISIGTNHPSLRAQHLFKLFELRIKEIEPDLGIELFVLEASKVESLPNQQEALWLGQEQNDLTEIAELLDRIGIKAGKHAIKRYLPQAQHWPEHSMKMVTDLSLQPTMAWPSHKPRPNMLLKQPEPIQVSAPIPDYPPMSFVYKGQLHRIAKADGPERIEREWWLAEGKHRDYYYVEDEKGQRYWLFRLGHYDDEVPAKWFIHGFFA